MHYSFDFAQQIHYPSDPLQPGPIYFLTPRKCGIFGVCCEAIPQQVNYLINEGMATSKGSDAVISYLHPFFDNYGLGEDYVHLHCDNCAGQNKNRYMLFYLIWRTIHQLHLNIELHFMVAGHTKFGPDWCFGLLKQKFRRTPVSCLDDMVRVTKESTMTGVNLAQLVGNENHQVQVPLYSWQTFFFGSFKPLLGMKQFHHFRFSSEEPGVVFARKQPTDTEQRFDLRLRRGVHPPAQLPVHPQASASNDSGIFTTRFVNSAIRILRISPARSQQSQSRARQLSVQRQQLGHQMNLLLLLLAEHQLENGM
ncbi:hypothetical protein LSAT2_026916 [Lamellibrachia satsuma]|nr:hypothetical protein LSAT2_026916 [Lamellibrachia satsuma]